VCVCIALVSRAGLGLVTAGLDYNTGSVCKRNNFRNSLNDGQLNQKIECGHALPERQYNIAAYWPTGFDAWVQKMVHTAIDCLFGCWVVLKKQFGNGSHICAGTSCTVMHSQTYLHIRFSCHFLCESGLDSCSLGSEGLVQNCYLARCPFCHQLGVTHQSPSSLSKLFYVCIPTQLLPSTNSSQPVTWE